jgi:hypothetical protein
MRLAFLKLYSLENKAKITMTAFSQPNQPKKSKIFIEINNFENQQIFECLHYIPLYLAVVLAIFSLGH